MSDTKTSETSAAGAGGDAGAGNPKTAAKILKQVNYYFSVHNLPNDKFLLAETKKDAEGWVAIETLLKFNRLKALTTDASVVAAALGTSEVVAVNEAGDKVRRKEAIPEGVSFDDCTLYVKGFPDNATLDEIHEAFSEYGTVGKVYMRKFPGKKGGFKGSVFVTFETPESAEKVIAGDMKFMGRPLSKIMKKADYTAAKQAERKARNESKEKAQAEAFHEFSGVTRVKGGLLRINVADMASISQYELRNAVAKHGDLKFFEADKDGAVARFGGEGEADIAKKALESAETKFGEQVPTYTVMEGEAADAYWNKVDEFHKSRWESVRQRKMKQGSRKRRNNGGGRGGNAKRRR